MTRRALALLIAVGAVLATGCGADPAAPASTSLASTPPSPAPTVVANAPPTAGPGGTALRVVSVEVNADPAAHIGACPIEVTFSARISVAGGAGTVTFKWVSSDGDSSDLKTLTFAGPGSQEVSSSWTVNRDTVPTHAGWSAIDIISPVSPAATSAPVARAAFVFTCDADDDIEAIGFGIGGSDADCSIAKPMETFGSTDAVRMVANWWPSLASGTVVTIRLQRGGVSVDGYPVTTTLHESTKCLHGTVNPGFLPAGHYRMDLEPDTARAIGAEFDVK